MSMAAVATTPESPLLETPRWLEALEKKRNRPHRLAHEIGAGAPCLVCGDKCKGLNLHFWRKLCTECKCRKEDHDVGDEDQDYAQFEILFGAKKVKRTTLKFNQQNRTFDWIPPNVPQDLALEYLSAIPESKLPISDSEGAKHRKQQLERQLPRHDVDPSACHDLSDKELLEFCQYLDNLKANVIGQGRVLKYQSAAPIHHHQEAYGVAISNPHTEHVLHKHPETAGVQGSLKHDKLGYLETALSGSVRSEAFPAASRLEVYSTDPYHATSEGKTAVPGLSYPAYKSHSLNTKHAHPMTAQNLVPKSFQPIHSNADRQGGHDMENLNKPENQAMGYLNKQGNQTMDNLNKRENQAMDNLNKQGNEAMGFLNIQGNQAIDNLNKQGSEAMNNLNKQGNQAMDNQVMDNINKQGNQAMDNLNKPFSLKKPSDFVMNRTSPVFDRQNNNTANTRGDKNSNVNFSVPYAANSAMPYPADVTQDLLSMMNQFNVSSDQLPFVSVQESQLLPAKRRLGISHPGGPGNDNQVGLVDTQHSDVADVFPEPPATCAQCLLVLTPEDIVVATERAGNTALWHARCFVCHTCHELLVDLMYFFHKGDVYCGRHYSEIMNIPRCFACDELIFSKEYTCAESETFHIRHFCCYHCDQPLADKQYIPKNGQPVCLSCFQLKYGKNCNTCHQPIAAGDQRVSWKDLDFHVAPECFRCGHCRKSLLGGRFVVKDNETYCSKECVQA